MSTNEYASFFRINPATAAKAFQLLVDEEILYKKRGIGMFVSPTARETLQEQHRSRFFADVIEPMLAEARTIGIPIRDIIDRLEKVANEDKAE
jgi:DNA-binding transcriptional regulator YhcF (GntR family)